MPKMSYTVLFKFLLFDVRIAFIYKAFRADSHTTFPLITFPWFAPAVSVYLLYLAALLVELKVSAS
jgi:hypothetical protein